MAASGRVRIVIAEDSPTVANMLVRIFNSDPELEVAGVADDGLVAVQMVKQLRPDVVTMDILMPRLDGIESTRRIMSDVPTPVVIISSTISSSETEASSSALGAGALAAVAKPPGPSSPEFALSSRRLINAVKAVAGIKMAARPLARSRGRGATDSGLASIAGRPCRVVAIGASTGGPAVLAKVLAGLPSSFSLPVLIVQHMAPGFHEGFARWLDSSCRLPVKLAEAGETVMPGTVYVAPESRHMGIKRARIELNDKPAVDLSCPSVTYLFNSVAAEFGAATCAVILTGMGRDGSDGLVAVKAAGGYVIAQEEKSCAVFGMPGVAIREGLVDRVVLPEDVARIMAGFRDPALKRRAV